MSKYISLLILIGLVACQVSKSIYHPSYSIQLYPIIEKDLWGYINTYGDTIISPRFYSAGNFSEGLAPVRSGGTYGFINKTGKFVLPAIYDMALEFKNGEAKVYIDGQALLIDKKGKIQFQHDFKEFEDFNAQDVAIVTTSSGKYGLINRTGKLVVDTVFRFIHPFDQGVTVVRGLRHYTEDEDDNTIYEMGVINTTGEFIVPYGRYYDINPFHHGFALVDLKEEDQEREDEYEGLIDTQGRLRFKVPYQDWDLEFGEGPFSNGLAPVRIKTKNLGEEKVALTEGREHYSGVVNPDGKIIFSNPNWTYITPFKFRKAFAQDINANWQLIDHHGKVLNEEAFEDVVAPSHDDGANFFFQNGLALVEMANSWALIDTTGNIIKTTSDNYDYELTRNGNLYFCDDDPEIDPDYGYYYFAFWDQKYGTIIESDSPNLPLQRFSKGLLAIQEGSESRYVNRLGNTVWRSKEYTPPSGPFKIDYMLRGHFHASSPADKRYEGFGGWGGDGYNRFKEITDSLSFAQDSLSMPINLRDKALNENAWINMLHVANTTKDTFIFSVQDSRLYLVVQAKDKMGIWRDIYHLPSSWCGNSYHSIYLPPNHYWEFSFPVHEGSIKTKLRTKLFAFNKATDETNLVIYSNEIEGSVNPAQFWAKAPYRPNGIMDPYLE